MLSKSIEALAQINNLVELFLSRADILGEAPFLWSKQQGIWQAISWREASEQVAELAYSLRELGLKPGDRVLLVSENRPKWCIADLAVMAAGCISVPTYITNTVRDHQHILDNSGAKAAIISDDKLAKFLLPAVMVAPSCNYVIAMERLRAGQANRYELRHWDELITGNAGRLELAMAEMRAQSAKMKRDDLACIIYTSGTGGAPRGVRQHHGAILHNASGVAQVIKEDMKWQDEVFLSFLPLSHAYEHSAGQFSPIALGGQIYYTEGLEKLASNMEETRPTIMVVVPRLFEVLRTRIIKQVEKQGKAAQFLLDKALKLAEKQLAGKGNLLDKPLEALLDRTLRKKIQARFGGRIKALVSGGAPLNPEIGVFFHALGFTMLQGYGQTEAGPVIACNRPAAGIKMETVGPPMPNTEIKIAADGEILVRGELVMHGYWNNPEETARALKDGWLYTGDIGHFDEAGRVVITDRKRDMIVNDKGDNVAPQKVEGMLTLQPEISQAMIIGDNRPYMVGLIVPDAEWALEWARKQGKKFDLQTLQADPQFKSAVRVAVDRVNQDLSVIEKLRQFCFADAPFAVENEQLTPSMKIRRHKIRETYGDKLNGLYRS